MPNASLYDLLHNGQELPWQIRYSIAKDIAYGLSLLHSRHILHRDLKSLNVLLDGRLRARLADFGLAKVKTQSKTTTKAEGSVGTLAWMALELLTLNPRYSVASDVYAYAMTAWEIAAREVPYKGVAESVIKDEVKKAERAIIPDDCPPTFADLIKSCWAQDAKQRPNIDNVIASMQHIMQAEAQRVGQEAAAERQKQAEAARRHQKQEAAEARKKAEAERTERYRKEQEEKASAAAERSRQAEIAKIRPEEITAFIQLLNEAKLDQAATKLRQTPNLILAASKAIAEGTAAAQCNLGFLYANGRGVAQDYGQARAWYEKAAA